MCYNGLTRPSGRPRGREQTKEAWVRPGSGVSRRRGCVLGPHGCVLSLSLLSLCARGLEVRVRHPLRQRGQGMTVQSGGSKLKGGQSVVSTSRQTVWHKRTNIMHSFGHSLRDVRQLPPAPQHSAATQRLINRGVQWVPPEPSGGKKGRDQHARVYRRIEPLHASVWRHWQGYLRR